MNLRLNFWNGDGGGEHFDMKLDVEQYKHLREYLKAGLPVTRFDEEYFLTENDETPSCHYEMIQWGLEVDLVYVINLARV